MASFVLKNNLSVNLRPINLADAANRHRFFVELSLEQTGIVHTSDEIDFHTHESQDKIADFICNKRGLWLIAENSDKLVIGEIDISIKNLARIRHVGVLTVGVLKDYQRLGLGSALLSQAVQWSKDHGLKRIELSVFAHNKGAHALYEHHGFVVEGVRRNFLCLSPTLYDDDILMAKYL